MTDTKQILAFIAKLNEDAELIFQKKDETQQRISDEKSNVEKEAKKLKKKMEKSLSEYENSHFESVKAEIQSLIDTVKDDYYEQYESANVDEKEFGNLSLSKLQAKLDQIFADINRFAEDLNSSDFDKLVPPISIRSESESFYVVSGNGTVETFDCDSKQPSLRNSSPVSNIALGFFTACKRGICCIDSIVKAFRRGVAIEKFNSYVDTSANAWISEKSTSIQNAYKTELDKLFISENTQNSYRRFFQNIKKEGEQYDVDIHNGTSEYKTAINIGNIRLPVTSDDEKLKLFDTVLPLKENIKNGMISVPFIMNLKEHGSILLEIDANDEYPEEVKSFVNQLIIQFLLSFPPNRIKFCLVDIHDKMDLSQFSLMEKINAGILFDGIVHDNRIMEDAVRNMEQMMYDVKDKKLSYNNVNDVFEYNARFEANPQSVSLFVLTDFPYGLREDLAQRILNIVKNSSKTGIFTIVVHNKAIGGNYDCSDEKIQKFVAAMKEKAVFVRHANNAFVLSDDRIFTGKTEINRGLLPEIVETLRINAERSKQKVVSLSQMFDETDRLASLPDGILSSAAVLDIPIGVKGGEIQNLLLKTTGDGSAHAVVIGGTGSGKSNLLHTIIMNVCYKYSPDEVNLYLVDFKGGVEFKYYEANKVREKQLPHIKLTGLTSDLEDGVSILSNLQNELCRREDIFRKSNVEDIVHYRDLGYKMPRLFVIVDEIQDLFERDVKLGEKAIDILGILFKKGRAFGISILWASQNVPSVPGLKEKILSQIGNHISLRLNNPNEAETININSRAVENLNRPEKGLGVINDSRYGKDSMEFRVAYAESSDKRQKYADQIIEKWKEITSASQQEPLYIVGNDIDPQPFGGFSDPTRENIKSKAFENYSLQIGQNYITGKPYSVDLGIREDKNNLMIIGPDLEITRDLMGYALLSVISEHCMNSDYDIDPAKIYYANGEIISPKNTLDLYNVARNDFAEMIENISSAEKIKKTIANIYKLYKDRENESYSASIPVAYTPVFLIIHSLQRYADLFSSNPLLTISAEETASIETPATSDTLNPNIFNGFFSGVSSAVSSSTDKISFTDAFNKLMDSAGAFGIHFIVSVDTPERVRALQLRDAIGNTVYKVFTHGLGALTVSETIGTGYDSSNSINNPKIAVVAVPNERFKVRIYRYDDAKDSKWYHQFRDKLRALKG